MTAVRTAPAPVGPGAHRLDGVHRVGGALALVLAPWGFVVANTAYALAIRGGGGDGTGAETLALYAAHPTLVRVAVNAVLLAALLIIPAVVAVIRLVPDSWLVLLGGSAMVAGYVCYAAITNGSGLQLAMALRGGPATAEYAAAIDVSQADGSGAWVFGLFVLGNLVGTLVFAIGLLRSRAVPVWAPVLLICWPVLHVAGLALDGREVPQVIGAVLQAAGFAGLAYAVLRRS